MNKKEHYKHINAEIQRIMSDGESVKDFYRFAAQNPHIPLRNACQIVVSRPSALISFSFEEWNAMGRRIVKDSKGVKYYDSDGNKKFVFSEVDTHGDARYLSLITPVQKMLDGLSLLNGNPKSTGAERDIYAAIYASATAYLIKNDYLSDDKQKNLLLCEGVAYSLYCKTDAPQENIKIRRLPYSLQDNAQVFKDIYAISNLLNQEIEKAYTQQTEQVKAISKETAAPEQEKHAPTPQEPEKPKPTVTPYYQRYLDEQEKHPNDIVLIRLGDFYEAMDNSAVKLSSLLDLTLTGRHVGLPERVPMCGFPHHAFEAYMNKIIESESAYVIEDNGEIWDFKSKQAQAEQRAFATKFEEALNDEQDFEGFSDEDYEEFITEFADELDEETAETEQLLENGQDFESGNDKDNSFDVDEENENGNDQYLDNEDEQDLEDEDEQDEDFFDEDEQDLDEEYDEAEKPEKGKQPQEKTEKERKSIRDRYGKKKVTQPNFFDLFDEPKEKTPQEKLIERQLQRGSGFENGKFRIYEQYFTDPTVNEYADFLKHEYGIGGYSSYPDEQNHDSKGLSMRQRDRENPENEIVVKMKWEQVARQIADLIDNDNYFIDNEKQLYEQWKAEKDGKQPIKEPLSDGFMPPFIPIIERPAADNTDLNELELDSSELGGAKARFRSNVEAIRLVNRLFEQNRNPDLNEKKVLARYVGWGGIPQVFDEHNEQWSKEYSELKNLLSTEDYDKAKGSVLNAHYTSKEVIEGIYKALDRFGVKGNNRILEPALGTGNFFGFMTKEIAENAKLYGIELDNITGRIAQKLYPQANVQIKGFEQTTFPNNHFDVVVSNVPFGNYSVYDTEYSKHNFYIHDYFIAKGIDKLKPNGIMAVITSKGTMDKLNPTVRKHIADRAELLGAIRLPNSAFKQTANTEVTTDILFFQKREEIINANDEWIETSHFPIKTNVDGLPNGYLMKDVTINSYFAARPEMMLGSLVQEHGLYGALDITLNPDGRNLSDAITDAINRLPQNIYKNPEYSAETEQQQTEVDYDLKPLCLKAENGKLYMRIGETMVEHPVPKIPQNAYERIAAMIDLRAGLRHVLDIQSEGCSDEVLKEEQRKLNQKYDRFVKYYGFVNSQTNTNLFREDGDSALLFASENLSEDKKTAEKADVFSKRTIRPYSVVTHTDDCFEALQISKNEKGKVDIAFIEELTNKDYDTVLTELDKALFRNPLGVTEDKYSGFETAEEYLSGEVVKKLKIADQFVRLEKKPEFERNVKALTEVQPAPIKASEISARIGASWINKSYYHQFICELLKVYPYYRDGVELFYNPHDGSWRVDRSDYIRNQTQMNANEVFGTQRASAFRLFEDCLNLKATQIYDTVEEDGKTKRVLNHNETVAAREKQNKIKEAFKEWIFKDPERRDELETKYNSLFNQIRLPSYDGSYLKFPQSNPAIVLDDHQKDAVHRAIVSGNTLFDHVVGAGKTFTICATAMKLRQYGLANKPMIVVPNHLVEQWGIEFRKLYPKANLFITSKEDLEKENRKRFVSKVAMGNWDAVIIAQSSFNKISISSERQVKKIQEEIFAVEQTIANLWDEGIAPRSKVKNLERIKKNKEAFLKKLMDGDKKDNVLTFEKLGVDYLFVDEAHYYKNLFLYTKMNNVAGISSAASQRASDLQLKCEYINDLHNADKGIAFATGTPISNSMTEMYTMQTYLQKRTLQNLGITYFDAWAANFGETITSLEMAPSGKGYKAKTRFAKFTNLPELLTLFRSFADVKTADMIKLKVPEVERKIITLKPSDTVLELAERIAERAEKIGSGGVDPSIDNMLKITSDGKKLALDARCFDILAADEPTSKLNECANRVFEIWENTQEIKGTQLVFCDLSTPKKAFDDYEYGKDFDVYNDLKYKLVQKGIPADEIAFIHDANSDLQKQALFNSVNDGKVRVLIGSTEKCGAGTNVQKRLVALHHLDTPYRPSDLMQREGRIVRQGNTNEKVLIFTYVMERTFDSYSYQILENKSRFIAQIDRGDLTVREADDIDETTLSYAEIKAITAANPKIKRKMEVDTEIARLRILEGQYTKNLYSLQDKIRKSYPEQIHKQNLYLERIREDIKTIKQNYNPDMFSISVLGTIYTDKKEGGKALMDAFFANKTDTVVAEFCGFKLSLDPLVMLTEERSITIKGAGEYTLTIGISESGTLTRLDNFFKEFPAREKSTIQKLLQLEQDLETAKEQVTKPFEHTEQLAKLLSEQTQINAELDLNRREEIVIDDSEDEEESESDVPHKEVPQNNKEVKTRRRAMSAEEHKAYKKIQEKEPDAYIFALNGSRYELIGEQAKQLAEDYGLPLVTQELNKESLSVVSLEADKLDNVISKLVENGNQVRVIEPVYKIEEKMILVEEKIINNEEKEIALLPDYTVTLEDKQDYSDYPWEKLLFVREQSAERLIEFGLQIYTLYPDDEELRPRRHDDSYAEPRKLFSMAKEDWHNFLKTDTAIEYLSARFTIINAAERYVKEELNFSDEEPYEHYTIDFKNSNNAEKQALTAFLTGKDLDDKNAKKYLSNLLDEFIGRINNYNFLNKIGITGIRESFIEKIENEELRNYAKQITLLPDYSLSEEIMQNAHSSDMLPLGKRSAERLNNLGFEIYMIFPEIDEPPVKVRYGMFNHNGLYGVKKADWHNYLDTDSAVEYLSARFVIAKAAGKVAHEDLSYVDEGFTIGFSNSNHDEEQAIKDYFSGKTAAANDDIKGYLPDLIDEFTARISGWYLEHYGWDSDDVKRAIIGHIGNPSLREYAIFDMGKNGLMIKSQVEGWEDWSTKTLPPNVRIAAEWLIQNGYENESDVKSAFYSRQTSHMSDDGNAVENDNAAIIRVAEKYGKSTVEKNNDNQNKGNKTKDPITVLVRRVGQEPTVEVIENTLEAKQEIVGGYIEMPYHPDFSKDLQIVCNEEATFVDNPEPNVYWGDSGFMYGDILFVGIGEDGKTISLTPKQIDEAKKWIAENDASEFENAETIDLAGTEMFYANSKKMFEEQYGNQTACRRIADQYWGEVQHESMLMNGVYSFSSAGHGGYVVDSKVFNLNKIPEKFFYDVDKQFAVFEEDCDWAVLFYFYPELSEQFYKNAAHTHSPSFYERRPTHDDFFQISVVGTMESYHKELLPHPTLPKTQKQKEFDDNFLTITDDRKNNNGDSFEFNDKTYPMTDTGFEDLLGDFSRSLAVRLVDDKLLVASYGNEQEIAKEIAKAAKGYITDARTPLHASEVTENRYWQASTFAALTLDALKEDFYGLEDSENNNQARKLFTNKMHNLLNVVYAATVKPSEQLSESIKNIKEERLDNNKYIPIYKNSIEYAIEHSEINSYRESITINTVCRNEIEQAIRENFKDNHLNTGFEKPIIEKHGLDRVAYVIANTVQYKDNDGRFSRENKEWAKTIPIYETDKTVMSEFVIDTHPVLTDAFANRIREAMKQPQEKKEEKPEEKSAETPEPAKEKKVWLKVNVARDALVRKYEKSSFMRMPTNNPDYADYTYNIFNNNIKESRQIVDVQSDTSELSYELNIAENQEIRLTNKSKEEKTLTGKELAAIIGGTTSKDYETKKKDDEKQWFAVNMPEEAIIGKYESTLIQLPNDGITKGYSFYVPNNFVRDDEGYEENRIIVRLPEDFEITAKNKEKQELKLSAFQLFERCNDSEASEYLARKGAENGNGNGWTYFRTNAGAKIADYENRTLFKMPKGEYENFFYYLPNKLVKENEEKGTLTFGLPNEIIIKLSNNKIGKNVDLSVEQFLKEVKDKTDADYNSNFQKPSESKANAFAAKEKDFADKIPDEMKNRPNWCIVRTKEYEVTKDNITKTVLDKYLVDCKTGDAAEINNPATWTDFKTACEYAKKNRGETLAYALDGKDNICCIDLDRCVDENGNYSALAKDLISKSKGTYTERSISGKGVHIFGKTDGLDLRCFSIDGDLEFYEKSRFMTMTGNILDNSKELKNLDNTEVKAVLEKKCAKRTELKGIGLGLQGLSSMSDRDVVEKAIKSKGGDTFKALYYGQDLQNNHSNSDMCLMNRLAFWCNGDKEQMLRIFGTSGLYRQEKSINYYEHTVMKAIKDTSSRYEPHTENKQKPPENKKPNGNGSGGNGKA